MLGGVANLLGAWGHALGAVAVLAVAALVVRQYRERLGFWWTDFCYRFPLVGRLALLQNDPTRANEPGWYAAERRLCADYYRHIQPITRYEFNNSLAYIRKAYDAGRKPLPLWMLLFLGVLIVAEGLGFSYLLGSQMALEGSENTRTLLMIAIVLVISGILMWVTHAAGHQLHRTRLLKSCLHRFRRGGLGRQLAPQIVTLDLDQSIDDQEDEASQCVSRLKARPGDTGSWVWVVIAAVAILSIGIGSTWLRFAHFEAAQTESTVSDRSDPFAGGGPALPGAVTAPQAAADAKAATESGAASASEAMAAFIMLGFIFVVTQLVGIGAGFRYGFAGKQSDLAYHRTQGLPTFENYWAGFQAKIELAQARLQALQQGMEANADHEMDFGKRFMDYVREQKETRADHVFAGNSTGGGSSSPEAINRALERLKRTRLETEKVAILAMLSDADRAAVKARLREQKGGGGGERSIAAEFEGLL